MSKCSYGEDELKNEKDKYESGEMVYFTDFMGKIWHSDKIVQQLKAENEELKKQVQFKNQFRDYAHKYKATLDEVEEICEECKKHDYDLCITCKYEEKCRGKEFEQYDVTNYILEKLQKAKEE